MAGFADPLCQCPGLNPGSGAAGGPPRRSGQGCWAAGELGATGLCSPAGERPDASLPLRVLPLYSLLAPEKQAQVTVRGLGWMPGGERPKALRWEQVRRRVTLSVSCLIGAPDF